jgi:hypothetical protein
MIINSLHVYAQESWHEEAYIVGDRNALMRLRNQIDRVLAPGLGTEKEPFFTFDGEGFDLHVVNLEGEEGWNRLAMPYTSEIALENRANAVGPHEIVLSRQKRTV